VSNHGPDKFCYGHATFRLDWARDNSRYRIDSSGLVGIIFLKKSIHYYCPPLQLTLFPDLPFPPAQPFSQPGSGGHLDLGAGEPVFDAQDLDGGILL